MIKISIVVELIYPENVSSHCAVRFELYDANGLCVDTDSTSLQAEYGTEYAKEISFKMVEPGEYTVKLLDYE